MARARKTGQLTINEGLAWLKVLKNRHAELVALRNQNAEKETRYYGANADKSVDKTPVYDVKALDKMIGAVAKEQRLLDSAIKATNVSTIIKGYSQNEAALGELS